MSNNQTEDEVTLEEREKLVLSRVEEEFRLYDTEVKHLVNAVEVAFERLPEGALLESKKFLGHISSAVISKDKSLEKRLAEIDDAHAHLRRLLLDCYKFMCINGQEQIDHFKHDFRFYDLNSLDDGKFMGELNRRRKDADAAFKEAKDADSTGKNSRDVEETVYDKYQAAFDKYCFAKDYIDEHTEGAELMKKRQNVSRFFTVAGWAISIALAVVLFILGDK